ncbi:MAG: shikimate kinase, partial [Clostridia bacterium]
FTARGAEIYYVELAADFDTRIARNKTPNRLANKPTKRDVVWSEELFRRTEASYRLNSREGEMTFAHYMKLDNTDLSPEEAARRIQDNFFL